MSSFAPRKKRQGNFRGAKGDFYFSHDPKVGSLPPKIGGKCANSLRTAHYHQGGLHECRERCWQVHPFQAREPNVRSVDSMSANRRKNRRKALARRRNLRQGLLFESLEDRRMLAVFAVSNLDDAGAGSLRDAISQANITGGSDSIEFVGAAAAGGTINLASQLPTISDALTIQGPGADLLTIDAGSGADLAFNTQDGFRIFDVDDGDSNTEIDVTISGLALSGGDTSGNGGAIRNRENLTVVDSIISGNAANPNGLGGGIYSDSGTLDVSNSTIKSNQVGYGGGIFTRNGTLNLTRSTISSNVANFRGGGVFGETSMAGQSTVIADSTLSGNTAGSAGGGLSNQGYALINSSTFTNNSAGADGGGIASVGNSITQTFVRGSIIAGNSSNDVAVVISSEQNSFVSAGSNLLGSGGGILNGLDNFTAAGDQTNVANPLLGSLRDNGGLTQTHALLPNSPAIDAGLAFSPTDQRGFSRDDGNGVDVGAFEVQPLVVSTTSDIADGDFTAGNLSLREAIAAANQLDPGLDNTITFDPSVMGTLILGSQLPVIISDLAILGPGADLLTINAGNGVDNTFGTADGFRIFNIDDGDAFAEIDVSISGLTLAGGDVKPGDFSGDGGAIRNRENLTLTDSILSGNAAAFGNGGGIDNRGTLMVASSTLADNLASSNGGGIYSYTLNSGALRVSSSTINGNSANSGGGIHNVSNETNSQTAATITNSTLSGNTATIQGGGLFNYFGIAVIELSTITGNTAPSGKGGGVASRGYANVRTEVSGTIISGNINGDVAVVSSTQNNSFQSNGFNLIGSGGGTLNGLANFTATGDQIAVTNPLLGPLADNGGPTQTHALLFGSPALNAGDPTFDPNTFTPPLVNDQRGVGFARVVIGTIDIGAFELQNQPPVITSPDTASVVENTVVVQTLTATDINGPTQTITFSVMGSGADNAFFEIVASELRFISAPDFELPADAGGDNVYEVSVLANDGGGGTTPQTITVTVTDVSETFVVDTTIDESDGDFSAGDLSLREAIELANFGSLPDTITFDPAVFTGGSASLIRLTLGELVISASLRIDGAAGVEVTITGDALGNDTLVTGSMITDVEASLLASPTSLNDNSRVLNFSVNTGDLMLDNLTVTGGRTTGTNASGGGIRFAVVDGPGVGIDGTLSLTNSTVSGNSTTGSNASGGGISMPFSPNTVFLTSSIVSDNSSGDAGGGISGNNVYLTSSTVSNNTSVSGGGGILSVEGFVNLTNSTVSGNTSGSSGGGIASSSLFNFGRVTLNSSTVSGNTNTGITATAGFTGGGGIYAYSARVFLYSSTISGNTALSGNNNYSLIDAAGGGIFARSNTVMFHSTVTGNIAEGPGGGVFIVRNPQETPPSLESYNSIIEGNTDNGTAPDVSLLTSATPSPFGGDYNIIGNTTGSGIDANSGIGNILNQPALLGPLADNGGPTQTHKLLLGSPAINAGDPSAVAGQNGVPVFDQRGTGFDRVVSRIDIGALERQTEFPSLIVTTATDAVDSSDFETSLREAIHFANSQPGAATITFSTLFATPQSILLGSQLPTIVDTLTITGPGADLLTIDAGGGTNGMIGNADGFRLLNIDDDDAFTQIAVSLSGLTLTGGDVSNADLAGEGGAIRNLENLTLDGIAIENNSARNNGGGIFNDGGLLVVNQSTLSGNLALFNRGGGIYTRNGSLEITDSTVSGNQSPNAGGGISSNTDLAGQITTISNSTISGNISTSGLGGGLFNSDGLTVIHSSTITNNTAGADQGSGVASRGNNATRTEVSGSIIAGNTNDDVAVTNLTANNSFQSYGYNVIGSGGGTLDGLANFTATGDQTNVTDPLLGPLADNGGPTLTHALLPGSPAIDAGDPIAVAGQNGVPVFDQRGAGFERVFGGRLDIGSYEFIFAKTIDLEINGGAINRSGIATLTIDFDRAVTLASPSALRLFNHTTSQSVDIASATLLNNGTSQITWDLAGVSLPDGRYTAELVHNNVIPVQIHTFEFHVRQGDLNGNTRVDAADFGQIGANFDPLPGLRYRNGDANGDGRVDAADFGIVGTNFNPIPLPAIPLDFGDAPEAGTAFPTTLARNGPRHMIGSGLMLGTEIDGELDGQPSAGADGDGSDEDGITIGSLVVGSHATIGVTTTGGDGFLNAWIDFNQDGDFDDPGEHVIVNSFRASGSTASESFNVPSDASAGQSIARFRLTSSAGYSYFGLAPDGEVEDYSVQIVLPASMLASNLGASGFSFVSALPEVRSKALDFATGVEITGIHRDRKVLPPINQEPGLLFDATLNNSKTRRQLHESNLNKSPFSNTALKQRSLQASTPEREKLASLDRVFEELGTNILDFL